MERTLAAAGARSDGVDGLSPARCPPVSGWTWPRATKLERFFQGGLAVVLAGAVALGFYLVPDPSGMGTHCHLGLPPCGMLVTTGKPCPTCGVTTSFVLAAHGRFGEALINQPFGLILFLLAVAGLLLSVTTVAAGRSWYPLVTKWSVPAFIMALVILGLVSWIYKWSVM